MVEKAFLSIGGHKYSEFPRRALIGWDLFLIAIATLSVVDGVLRVRAGAAWEISVLLILFLLLHISVKTAEWSNHSVAKLVLAAGFSVLIVANASGYLMYARYLILNDLLENQIFSIEARMLVESIRFIASIGMFALVLVYANTRKRCLTVMRFFIYGAVIQAIYAIYEVTIKTFGLASVFPLLTSGGGNYLSIPRAYGTFYEPSQLGQFLVVSIFLISLYIFLLNSRERSFSKIYRYRYVFFVLLGLGVLSSLSRAALLVFGITLIIGILLGFRFFIRRFFLRPVMLSLAIIFSLILYNFAIYIFGEEYFTGWWYLVSVADVDTTNSGAYRVALVGDYLRLVVDAWLTSPLGLGQGVTIVSYGMVPMNFRLPSELGVPGTVFYLALIIFAVRRCASLGNHYWIGMLVILSLVLVAFNYNSPNHPWLWFALAIVPALGAALKNEKWILRKCEL